MGGSRGKWELARDTGTGALRVAGMTLTAADATRRGAVLAQVRQKVKLAMRSPASGHSRRGGSVR